MSVHFKKDTRKFSYEEYKGYSIEAPIAQIPIISASNQITIYLPWDDCANGTILNSAFSAVDDLDKSRPISIDDAKNYIDKLIELA